MTWYDVSQHHDYWEKANTKTNYRWKIQLERAMVCTLGIINVSRVPILGVAILRHETKPVLGGWTLDVVTWENLGHCDLWLKPLNCFKKETPPSKKNWLGSKFRRFTMGKQRQKNCPANVRTNLLLSVWRRNYKTSFTWLFASCVVGGWTLDTWENLGRRGVKRKSAI